MELLSQKCHMLIVQRLFNNITAAQEKSSSVSEDLLPSTQNVPVLFLCFSPIAVSKVEGAQLS